MTKRRGKRVLKISSLARGSRGSRHAVGVAYRASGVGQNVCVIAIILGWVTVMILSVHEKNIYKTNIIIERKGISC